MSDSKIISEVSNLLVSVLTEALKNAANPSPSVDLSNPAGESSSKDLSVWLYQVMPNTQRLIPPERVGFERHPSLPLDLFYLMTPHQYDEAKNQETLGRVLQVFHDSPILKLSTQGDVELRVTICSESLNELTEVWSALQKPYRLSVCYKVQNVSIDSAFA